MKLIHIQLGSPECTHSINTSRKRFIEIPGLYNRCFHDPSINVHPIVVKISNSYAYVNKNGYIYRQIKMLSNQGHTHVFTFHMKEDNIIHEEEGGDVITSNVITMINHIMDNFSQTKRRDMALLNPSSICIRKHCYLISDDVHHKSLFDIIESSWLRRNISLLSFEFCNSCL